VAQRTQSHGASDTLVELESGIERFGQWISDHRVTAAAIVIVLLASGATWEILRSRSERREIEASNAFDQTQNDYLRAMGAEPGAIEVPELANQEAAKKIRGEYVEKFRSVAAGHPGTLPAALAWLQSADLLESSGDVAGALESLNKSLAEQPANPRLLGLVHQRIAQIYEDQGKLAEAAAEHETAGGIADFPLRFYALSDAARCYAAAGQRDKALALLERIEAEAKEGFTLSPPLRQLLRELRAAQPS
jgi:tetratricopeptide (TPR) repeat protein